MNGDRRKLGQRVRTFFRADAGVRLTLQSRLVSMVAMPVTILLVTRLSPVFQGFYYTFTSMSGMTMLIELGFGMVLTQFASHEFAHLQWDENAALTGDASALNRVLDMLAKGVRWYTGAALVIMLTFIPGGLRFFAARGGAEHINYALPWTVLVIANALSMLFVPVQAIAEGCGQFAVTQEMRFWQTILSNLLLWVCLFGTRSLYAVAAAASATVIVPAIWLVRRFPGLTQQMISTLRERRGSHVSWKTELLPMQWRIAVSWLSATLMVCSFNPLLFHYRGPTEAGQMGMSLTLTYGTFVFGLAWLTARFPRYGTLLRQGDYKTLDALAWTATWQAWAVCIGTSVGLIVALVAAHRFWPRFDHRTLSIGAVAALCVVSLITVTVQSMAGYLRAHKEEPYAGLSFTLAVVVVTIAWGSARYASANTLAVGYAVATVGFMLPVALVIFLRKRREWHGLDVAAAALRSATPEGTTVEASIL